VLATRPRPVLLDHRNGRVPATRHHPPGDIHDPLRGQLYLTAIQQHLDEPSERGGEFPQRRADLRPFLRLHMTLVVNFLGILARSAWRTRFGSCVPHDHPAARFVLVAFPSCAPQTGACDVCGATAVAIARAAGR
jgi:hypothetical protein